MSIGCDYCYLFGESLHDESNPARHDLRAAVLVKIGSTGNPIQRRSNLWTVQPTWKYHAVWFAEDRGLDLERELQRVYAAHCVKGEVFKFSAREILALAAQPACFFLDEVGGLWDAVKSRMAASRANP